MDEKKKQIENHIREILKLIGEDPEREGLVDTPHRVAKMYLNEIFQGYSQDPIKILNNAVFHSDYEEMVVVKDIDFYSMCEHHLIPFFGVVHVGYIPDGKLIGLSKIPRIVDMFARRLQIQEQMTVQIAKTLEELLEPKGVAVVVEGIHLCSVMRGVKKPRNKMITSEVRGAFRKNQKTREEFFSHIDRRFNLID
ncbi:GTP cyclohydrolase I [Thermotomaculum hydrothermale]|uniref:GTP cyclohydrolase 1 n=1 Tax=Thermotomaculum hydrothermale TaxID=981385 RepID=A0A7R6PYX4_9BACT|nr:GTP cyclohydrolase I FolE [Thermotomaculum hydrothermale]BBB33425.1 GTP cyclohydrolase I [Thermotomaculum hydrothermale]